MRMHGASLGGFLTVLSLMMGCGGLATDGELGGGDDPLNQAPSCKTVKCTADTHCELVEVQCVRAPCPPVAQCVPNDDDGGASCAATLCPTDTYCDDASGDAECLPLPSCAAVTCETGSECQLVDVQCVRAPCPPQPQCVPAENPCNLADCQPNTTCEVRDGEAVCVPNDDDAGSSCAATLCPSDTYCDDISGKAECLPLPSCAAVTCEVGSQCELVEVQCIRAPCPPQPQCVPAPTGCATVRCKGGYHCKETQVQCVRAPCPPITECVRD